MTMEEMICERDEF